jgi:hypothetical protein
MAFSTCENILMWKLILWKCPCVIFPSHYAWVEEVFPEMLTKPMKLHVLLHLASIAIVFTSFDL